MIPTIFIGQNTRRVIPWKIVRGRSFPQELIPDVLSYELFDAYWNVLDLLEEYLGKGIDFGLELPPPVLRTIKRRGLYLAGASVGLVWLIGLYAHVWGKEFPDNLFAWGAIRPVRNNSFALFPADQTEAKLQVARRNHARKIVLSQGETCSASSVDCIFLAQSPAVFFPQIEKLLMEYPTGHHT